MAATRLYLDTQQWNYLVEHRNIAEVDLERLRHCLVEGVRAGHLVVVSSLPLLREIMGAERRNARKYQLMRDLLFDATRHHWLRPLSDRYRQEARHGGTLPEPARYMSRRLRREVEQKARKGRSVAKIADDTYVQTALFKQDQEAIRTKMKSELPRLTEQSDLRLDGSWASVDIDEWVADAVAEGLPPGWSDDENRVGGFREGVPSAWLFIAFKLARIKRNLGEDRAIKSSDYIDAEHCAAGPYVDVLVTDDREFRATCELLPWCPFEIEGLSDLSARLDASAH